MSSPTPSLEPCKRYIATHDPNGKSIYTDGPDLVYSTGKARTYATELPADLANDADVAKYKSTDDIASYTKGDIVLSRPGSALYVIDFPPGVTSPMHRTVSIDYSICCIGTLECELDGGEKVTLHPGDHVVQRGTMHRWRNPSATEPARAIAVTLPLVPVNIPGVGELKEVFLPREESKI